MDRIITGERKARRKAKFRLLIMTLLLALVTAGYFLLRSRGTEIVPETSRPTNAHDDYIRSLRMSGLAHTALARDWITSAGRVLKNPIQIELPFEEICYTDDGEAFAVGYRFSVLRGQRIEADISFEGRRPTRLFIDLFRIDETARQGSVKAASAASDARRLEFEPRRDADYILRVQPELLRGGRCRIRIVKMPSLGFPVAGRDTRAIGSGFGVPREGGRRTHHGVDIFAPRHTPVTASARASVRFVGENRLGGNVIWLHDTARRMYYYYAHLQTQEVERGDRVERGQRIGTLGNSGNARTTPPHLHFGIYPMNESPVDPVNFLKKLRLSPRDLSAELDLLGEWARLRQPVANFGSESSRLEEPSGTVRRGTAMRILAASGSRYRVSLPDGRSGYVPARILETALVPLMQRAVTDRLELRDSPDDDFIGTGCMEPGEPYAVLARFADFWLVGTESGVTGWMPMAESGEADDL